MVDGGGKWSTVAPAGVTCVILEAKEVREMFLGTHAPRLDDKGRLVLPAKFREALAPGLVLTKGQERSIVVWPAAEFAAYAERLNEASRCDAKVRAYLRVLFSGAFDEQPDKQGRINIPPALRDYAGLDRDVIVVGNNSTVEIWDAGAWESYLGSQEDGFSGLSEEVVPGVL
jgi:MraZ protein